MEKTIVKCEGCGRPFDLGREGIFLPAAGGCLCRACERTRSGSRRGLSAPRPLWAGTAAKLFFGVLFAYIGVFENQPWDWTFLLVGLGIGLGLIAWGIVPLRRYRRERWEAVAAARTAAAEKKAEPLRRLRRPRVCAACGATGAGEICEYCGTRLPEA